MVLGHASLGRHPANLSAPEIGIHGYVVMADAIYGNYLLFFLAAALSSLGVIALCVVVDNKVLRYYGKNSLLVLGLHTALLGYSLYIFSDVVQTEVPVLVAAVVRTVCVLLVVIVPIAVINRYVPNLAGRKGPEIKRLR